MSGSEGRSMRGTATHTRGPSRTLWAVAALVTGAGLMAIQASAVGGLPGLLQVGEGSTLRPAIEEQLGPVPVSADYGHDAQIFYAIGLDLTGQQVGPLLDHAGYRYRRILYPFLASLGGTVGGMPLLVGMVTLSLAGFVAAAASTASIAQSMRVSTFAALAVVANPAVWLGMWTLTSDGLALGLALGGVALVLRGRWPVATVAFAAAALAKDVYLVVAISTAAWMFFEGDRRRALTLAVGAGAPLIAWSLIVSAMVSDGFAPRSNFGAPLVGIVTSAPGWPGTGTDLAFAVLALLLIVSAIAGTLVSGHRLLHLLTWPWVVMALTASSWVWSFGNNALRSFAFLAIPAALGFARRAAQPDSPTPLIPGPRSPVRHGRSEG